MLLKSINIQGFKSFADKTQLQFGKGITAVVGPNGSGKSNISDAVRWVLGEQSTKSLRGSSMEDVIFLGSDTRRPQGFAEVTLTIDNTDRSLNFDNDTVAVTRRYYRSHESEYLINGVSVRLRDVNELFMDTGLGRDGYSMIGQGKIDSIVGAKPHERRDIFEEASGISRYRYRKIEAERKLDAAAENMVRLRDIFSELESRVGPLKLQSEKAEKYLGLREERKKLEIGLWLRALDNSKDTLRNQDKKITITKAQYDDINTKLTEIEKSQENAAAENARKITEIENKRREAAELEETAARTEGEIAVGQNTVLHNNRNIERINFEIEGLKGSDETAKENIENERIRLEEKKKALSENEGEILSKSDELNRLVTESEGFSKQIEDLALQLNSATAESADMQVRTVSAETAIGEIVSRRAAINENKAELTAVLGEQQKELEALKHDREELEDSLSGYRNSQDGYKMRLTSREQKVTTLKAEIDKLHLDIEDNARRVEMLKELERNMEGFNHAVKEVMNEAGGGALRGIHGPFIRLIKVDKEYSVAIETALGNAAQNIVVDNENDAKRAIKMLKEGKKGRATFLPVATIQGRYIDEKKLEDCYGFVGIASDLIECDQKYREIAVSLLGRTIVAEDLDSAVSIAGKFGYKYKIVSLDGQQVHAGGSMTGGSLSRHSGLLSRAGEIAALEEKAKKLESKLATKQGEFKLSEESLNSVKNDIANIEAEITSANEDLIRVLAELRRVDELVNTNAHNLELLQKELVDCENREQENNNIIETAKRDSQDLTAKIDSLKAQIQEISGGRDGIAEKRDELTDTLTSLKLKNVELQKDIEQIGRTLRQMESDVSDREYRVSQLQLELEQFNEINANIGKHAEELKADIERFKKEAEEKLRQAEDLRREREAAEQQGVKIRAQERQLLDDKEKLSSEMVRLEERRASMVREYDDIIKRLFDEYELTRGEAEALNIVIEDEPSARRELAEIKGKIKALGNINVEAIDEYKEVKERYEYYKEQIEDVEKAQAELQKLISELTGTMRDLFQDGFSKINRNFQKTFTDLFGGGAAELVLSDPENILESGIDISVRIPGKTVSKIEPLSGGEKALVAISIYFAIMMVNPPPFCLLDEVESALDEVNVDRVAEYMHHMNASTQFICITHRRGTMEAADMLYGVTMQEKGVSRLLELNVSELERKLGIKDAK